MEVNVENKVEKKRLSIITDIIIFLFLLNVFLFGFKYISSEYGLSQNLALEDIEISNKNYIEAKNIKEKYGIDILYGQDSYESSLRVSANVQEDEYIIYKNITDITKVLSKYPDSFFVNNKLTIVILKSFNNSNIALASKNKLNEFKIYISDNKTFERSLHHEMYHVFEYKLNISKSSIFANWNEFNPKNFSYIANTQNLDDKYIYDSSNVKDDSYFVTKYSKTSEKEDRAEIFAEIMTSKSKPDYLYEGSNIAKKANYIKEIMTVSLTKDSNNTFYWNRF
ncbi:MAG: hypothetical protein K0R72_394 [Clostridia bacterium]|nr:hypothetical protein [Clostridia bacterium]